MYSVQTLERDLKGVIVTSIGSDGTRTLDGRYGYDRADYEAMEYYMSLKHIKPYLIGYRLLRHGNKVRDFTFE